MEHLMDQETSSLSTAKTCLPQDVLETIENNRRAAVLKRKLFPEEQESIWSRNEVRPSVTSAIPQQAPMPKRAKTEYEILREEELMDVVSHGQVVHVQGYHKLVDTAGGFPLDEKDLMEEEEAPKVMITDPAPIVEGAPTCLLCQRTFSSSFLFHTYDHSVCDACRDTEGLHSYITRTDAKTEFLLNDEDFDIRMPVLKFITHPNHWNPRRGAMKLYLRLQVEKRALEIWKSIEIIEARREIREENRTKNYLKKYKKELIKLRRDVRSNVYTKELSMHSHLWGEETYNEDNGEYTRICIECEKKETLEKMCE